MLERRMDGVQPGLDIDDLRHATGGVGMTVSKRSANG
jgi:hypothetical protein